MVDLEGQQWLRQIEIFVVLLILKEVLLGVVLTGFQRMRRLSPFALFLPWHLLLVPIQNILSKGVWSVTRRLVVGLEKVVVKRKTDSSKVTPSRLAKIIFCWLFLFGSAPFLCIRILLSFRIFIFRKRIFLIFLNFVYRVWRGISSRSLLYEIRWGLHCHVRVLLAAAKRWRGIPLVVEPHVLPEESGSFFLFDGTILVSASAIFLVRVLNIFVRYVFPYRNCILLPFNQVAKRFYCWLITLIRQHL